MPSHARLSYFAGVLTGGAGTLHDWSGCATYLERLPYVVVPGTLQRNQSAVVLTCCTVVCMEQRVCSRVEKCVVEAWSTGGHFDGLLACVIQIIFFISEIVVRHGLVAISHRPHAAPCHPMCIFPNPIVSGPVANSNSLVSSN